MARSVLRGAAFVGLCGGVGYLGTDALESALLFRTGSRLLLEHAGKDADLQEQLGRPLHISKWWNAAIGVRPGGLAADCIVQLSGTQRDANATIQMYRKPSSYRSILLYQLLGPGEWEVTAVNVMVAKGATKQRAANAV